MKAMGSYLNHSSLFVKFIFDLTSLSDLYNLHVATNHLTSRNSITQRKMLSIESFGLTQLKIFGAPGPAYEN